MDIPRAARFDSRRRISWRLQLRAPCQLQPGQPLEQHVQTCVWWTLPALMQTLSATDRDALRARLDFHHAARLGSRQAGATDVHQAAGPWPLRSAGPLCSASRLCSSALRARRDILHAARLRFHQPIVLQSLSSPVQGPDSALRDVRLVDLPMSMQMLATSGPTLSLHQIWTLVEHGWTLTDGTSCSSLIFWARPNTHRAARHAAGLDASQTRLVIHRAARLAAGLRPILRSPSAPISPPVRTSPPAAGTSVMVYPCSLHSGASRPSATDWWSVGWTLPTSCSST